MWASAHAQKMNIPVSMVTAAGTPRVFFGFFFREFPCRIIEVPDNGGPGNGGSTVLSSYPMLFGSLVTRFVYCFSL